MILGDVIERNARCFGNHPAILFEGQTITHGQFFARVRKLINALVTLGCKKQDRLAVLSRNCPEYLEADPAEQAGILADAQPAVFMYESEYAQRAEELRKHLPAEVHFICFDSPASADLDYEAMLAGASDTEPAFRACEDDAVLLIYTSGTTGVPKGVMLGNEGQLEQARTQALSHLAAQTDRMLIVMPFYHIGGNTSERSGTACHVRTPCAHHDHDDAGGAGKNAV